MSTVTECDPHAISRTMDESCIQYSATKSRQKNIKNRNRSTEIATHAQKSADKKFHLQFGGKDVALDLITIHADRLSDLGDNKHVVCVDLKAANGAIYDVDFFITVRSGTLSVTEASVHKIKGKPLYNWKEEGGIFKKVKA